VTVVVDPEVGVIGVGDHLKKKDAEKLAAISALLQLRTAGVVSIATTTLLMTSLRMAGPLELLTQFRPLQKRKRTGRTET